MSGSCFIFVHGRFMRSLHPGCATPSGRPASRGRNGRVASMSSGALPSILSGVLSPKKTGSGASCRSSSRPRSSCYPTATEQSTTGPQRTSSKISSSRNTRHFPVSQHDDMLDALSRICDEKELGLHWPQTDLQRVQRPDNLPRSYLPTDGNGRTMSHVDER